MKELSKEEIRKMIWDLMVRKGIARFPLPPHGRIPNFVGAEKAARNLFSLAEWKKAEVVKVNPDSPQKYVRLGALEHGKVLIMPTPRIRKGFILLDPKRIPERFFKEAITIRGAFKWGVILSSLNQLKSLVKKIDLIVEGSVAVNLNGNRLGKGEGYGELEYAILKELGLIEKEVPIVTTVHDIQILNFRLPQDPYDVPVDVIVTPSDVIRVKNRGPRPEGLLMEMLPPNKIKEIPILAELIRMKKSNRT